jgi:hypothetical protein
MDGFSVEDSRRIRWSAEHTPETVECPKCTPTLGRPELMKGTKDGLFTTWLCANCGQRMSVFTG